MSVEVTWARPRGRHVGEASRPSRGRGLEAGTCESAPLGRTARSATNEAVTCYRPPRQVATRTRDSKPHDNHPTQCAEQVSNRASRRTCAAARIARSAAAAAACVPRALPTPPAGAAGTCAPTASLLPVITLVLPRPAPCQADHGYHRDADCANRSALDAHRCANRGTNRGAFHSHDCANDCDTSPTSDIRAAGTSRQPRAARPRPRASVHVHVRKAQTVVLWCVEASAVVATFTASGPLPSTSRIRLLSLTFVAVAVPSCWMGESV